MYATADAMGDANVTDLNFNMTWVFSVDPSFVYLIRLHFCDIISKALNILVFNMYVNSDKAIPSFGSLSSLKEELSVPYYKDFVSNSSNGTSTLTVSVGPDTMADFSNADLNGLEIMKISNDVKSFNGLNSISDLLPESPSKKENLGIIIGSALGGVGVIRLLVLGYFVSWLGGQRPVLILTPGYLFPCMETLTPSAKFLPLLNGVGQQVASLWPLQTLAESSHSKR